MTPHYVQAVKNFDPEGLLLPSTNLKKKKRKFFMIMQQKLSKGQNQRKTEKESDVPNFTSQRRKGASQPLTS